MVHPIPFRRRALRAARRARGDLGILLDDSRVLRDGARGLLRRGRLVVVVALLLAAVSVPPRAERLGDALQVALPLAGLACAVGGGGALPLLGRFVVLEAGIHGPKTVLGDAPINLRPNGSDRGFPSGHTSAAAFGASAVLHHCLRNAPLLQGATIVAAGFVGASRIEAGAHDIWQVLAGVLWGVAAERALRRAQRRRIVAWWARRRAGPTQGAFR